MWKRSLILLLIPLLLLLVSPAAKANVAGASNGKAAGVFAGLAGAGALIGLAIYYAVHHGHALRGCVVSSPGGLQLVNEGDQQTYELIGATAVVKPGDRVRVSGKKTKHDSNQRQFVVIKLSKDYGACRVTPATP